MSEAAADDFDKRSNREPAILKKIDHATEDFQIRGRPVLLKLRLGKISFP
jgi:hypothetical protein